MRGESGAGVPWRALAAYAVLHAAGTALLDAAARAHPAVEWAAVVLVSALTGAELALAPRRSRLFAAPLVFWLVQALALALWRAHWVHHAAIADLAPPVVRAAFSAGLYALAIALGAPLVRRPDLAPVLLGACALVRLAVPPPPPPPLASAVAAALCADVVGGFFCVIAAARREAVRASLPAPARAGASDAAEALWRVAPLACAGQCAWLGVAPSVFAAVCGATCQLAILWLYVSKVEHGAVGYVRAVLVGRIAAPRATPGAELNAGDAPVVTPVRPPFAPPPPQAPGRTGASERRAESEFDAAVAMVLDAGGGGGDVQTPPEPPRFSAQAFERARADDSFSAPPSSAAAAPAAAGPGGDDDVAAVTVLSDASVDRLFHELRASQLAEAEQRERVRRQRGTPARGGRTGTSRSVTPYP